MSDPVIEPGDLVTVHLPDRTYRGIADGDTMRGFVSLIVDPSDVVEGDE